MTVHPAVLVLPAFTAADHAADPGDPDEVDRWLEAYDFEGLDVPGVGTPVRYDHGSGVALAPTGIGKSAAAATTGALFAADALALGETTVLTAGIAGCRPAAGTVGSVFVADAVVDWDLKTRIDGSVDPLSWRVRDYAWDLNDDLVDRAVEAVRGVELADDEAARELRARYDDDRSPEVAVGPTVCGDEVWHGEACAAQVESLCAGYGVEGYATTEMEDAATVTALERVGALDRYVSVRAAANFDRASPGHGPADTADTFCFEVATENAFRAGRAAVAAFLR